MRHHDPGVADLAGGHTHQSCVPMLPPGGSQSLPDRRRGIWLVATAYEQRDTPEQDVESQTGVPILWSARETLLCVLNHWQGCM